MAQTYDSELSSSEPRLEACPACTVTERQPVEVGCPTGGPPRAERHVPGRLGRAQADSTTATSREHT
jgi:hypothetical protein